MPLGTTAHWCRRYRPYIPSPSAAIIVEPPKLVDYTSPISVVEFFHKLKKYYTAGGKICLEILLRDLLLALTLRVDTVKYTTYDTSNESQLYHIGWVYYTSFRFLQCNKHLLLEHLKTFRQSKSSIMSSADELASRNKYIVDFKEFFTNFGVMWSTPSIAYAALQKPHAKSFAFLPVTTQLEHLASDSATMDGLLRLTIQQESNLSSLVKINAASLRPVPTHTAAGATSATTTATGRDRNRNEGKKANAAVCRASDGFCTNPTSNRTKEHNTFKCAVACAIPECPTKDIPHPAKSCFLLRSKDLSGPYFQSFEVCPPTVPLHPTRRRSPPPTRRDLENPWRSKTTWRQMRKKSNRTIGTTYPTYFITSTNTVLYSTNTEVIIVHHWPHVLHHRMVEGVPLQVVHTISIC